MHATAWHNGSPPAAAAGYGIKFTNADRDRYFDRNWREVDLEMEDGQVVTVRLSLSFWRKCSEVRSARIGRWLLETGAAPWERRNPPGIAVMPLGGNRFSVRILKRRVSPESEMA